MLFSPTHEIRVEGGRFYDYSAWIKTSALEGEAYLRVTFWSHQGDPPVWNFEGEALTDPVTDTKGSWVPVTGSVQVPANAEYARVEATLPGASLGTVCFDDISLRLAPCLAIGKDDYPDPVAAGDLLTYSIVYSNTGREEATNVLVVEGYDRDVTYERAQPLPRMGETLWSFTELPPGSGVITVVVDVDDVIEGRNWLFNTVEISSTDILKSISTTIATRLDTSPTAAISIVPPKQSGVGKPGSLAEYDLRLRNEGSCSGQVVLTSTSSLGWGSIPGLNSPCILPGGSFTDTSVTVDVPSDASGSMDVTLITATLTCEAPCNEIVVATAVITTTVSCTPSVVCLPMVMQDYWDCFPGPWEVEPNNPPGVSNATCEMSNGPLCAGSDREYNGYLNDVWDYFNIDLYTGGGITVDLTVPVGREKDVQLQLRDEECKLLAYDWSKPYRLEHTGVGAGRYYIAIYTASDYSYDEPYVLRTTFP
jgi:uncharacterized repeat protein (TIGR01451 family)